MKLAILGGSFDPPHLGHLYLAETALTTLGYDRIILVPAFQSPFKPDGQETSAADRLDMLAASIPADPCLGIDACEIERQGVSYTIDTLEELIRRYRPEGKIGLILGDDLAQDFSQWYRAGDIVQAADIVIGRRLSAGPVDFPYPYRALENEVMELSSGMVRERIQQGRSWRSLVPLGARLIIEERGLYGCRPPGAGASAGALSTAALTTSGAGAASPAARAASPAPGAKPLSPQIIARIEEALRSMVSPARFLHSRGVALLSYDLCRRYGLDPARGYLAGIAHDIAKSLGEAGLLQLARRDDRGVTKLERAKPGLLHGKAGAVLLRERFLIEAPDILEAVREHTTGSPGMGPLAKVVYVADKIEASRKGVDPELRDLDRYADLDDLFTAVLDETVAYLRSQEVNLSPGTQRLLTAMHTRRPL
jgi:nicotinate-nucleotide adenylyltransferase